MERVAGIEPARSAWEADRLPLHHTRAPFIYRCARRRAMRACLRTAGRIGTRVGLLSCPGRGAAW